MWSAIEATATAVATVVAVLAFLTAWRSNAKADRLAERLAAAQEQIGKEIAKLRPEPEVAWELVRGGKRGGDCLRNVGNATAYNVRHPGDRLGPTQEGFTVEPRGEISMGLASFNYGRPFTVTWEDEAGQPRTWTGMVRGR